jgi:carboxylesterase
MRIVLYLSCLLLTLTINVSASQNETPKITEKSMVNTSDFNNDPNECIMLIHGFGGSIVDFKPLTDIFDSLGVNYYAITLSGHGTTPEDLKDVKHEAWLAESSNAFDSLSLIYDRVSLIGFSMGGAICIILSSKRNVHKLTVLSPYFEVNKKWYYFGKPEIWAKRFSNVFTYIKKLKIGQINDPKGLEKYDAYRKVPLQAVTELSEIGKLALSQIADVRSPILWLHSKKDIVSDFTLSKNSFDRVTSTEKTFIKFSESNHIILYDYESNDAINEILKFLGVAEHLY